MCFAFNHKIFSVENMIYIFFKTEDIPTFRHCICLGGNWSNSSGNTATMNLFRLRHIIATRVGHGPQFTFQTELKRSTLKHTEECL